MGTVQYGSKLINYSILERKGLKSHYITVEKQSGVTLKGQPISEDVADSLILKKARWILEKLEVVRAIDEGDIVTGSRIPYLGKSYYVQVVVDTTSPKPVIVFNQSKFIITVNRNERTQEEINDLIQGFYKEKAIEKISPRVEKFSQKTGLQFKGLQFRKMTKRWGSCTGKNRIIINTDSIKLPFSLIDYLIVHELVHTRIKDHSKRYWSELSRHMRGWETLDRRMKDLKL